MGNNIHPQAFVSPKAELGGNVTVGPCALIEDNAIIGEGCIIDAFASVKQYTTLGKNNHIHSYAVVGGVPQDLKFRGEVSRLEVGDSNSIREFSTLHRGTEGGGGITRVGSNCLLMAYTHVAHDCQVGDRVVMSNNATLAGHVTVGDFVIISGLSAVHQFTRIGRHAFIGGMTGVGRDLPPFMLAFGGHAGAVRGLNLIGLRRMQLPRENIVAVREAFRIFWLSGLTKEAALAEMTAKYSAIPEVMELAAFIRQSARGVLHLDKEAAKDSPDEEA